MRRRLVIAVLAASAWADERSPRRVLDELTRKLERRKAAPGPVAAHGFLHEQAEALIARAREAQRARYVFDRLTRAAGDLLEASESLFEAGTRGGEDDDDREDAARLLERTYFRVQQADYFARQSNHKDGGAFITHSRSLYQQARTAYDQKDYRKARKLADAAGEIVEALERLAQAEVRVPEPPRLK